MLKDFLLRLSQDYGLQLAYAADAEKVMREHKLSDADKALLRSGDDAAIQGAIDGDLTVAKVIFVFEPEQEPVSTAQLVAA